MTGLERVLVATDGAEFGGRAVATAAGLVKRAGGELHIVTVADASVPPVPSERAGWPAKWLAAFDEHNESRAQAQTREVGVPDAPIHVRRGYPAQQIAEAARELNASLLAIGAHRGAALERALLGSTGEKVARTAECPILVAAEAHPGPFERVLAPVDISPQSREVLENAVRIGVLDNARVQTLYVQEPLSEALMEVSGVTLQEAEERKGQVERSARTQFEELAAEVGASRGIELDAVERTGRAGPEIVEAADEWDADLLVLGTHGHGFVHRMLLGSTSQHVLRHTDRPVLLVPAAEGG